MKKCIPGHEGNANRNNIEILPHCRTQMTNVGEDAGEKGTLTQYWWECKLV
jgi:hypothetical protein